VLSTRIRERGDSKKLVEVEWQGHWYAAEILRHEGERYFITYVGYDSSWDEWVSRQRIRFPNDIKK
jgi:hypothetical protein